MAAVNRWRGQIRRRLLLARIGRRSYSLENPSLWTAATQFRQEPLGKKSHRQHTTRLRLGDGDEDNSQCVFKHLRLQLPDAVHQNVGRTQRGAEQATPAPIPADFEFSSGVTDQNAIE